jgi:toxin ParE1/3/4
MSRIVVSPEALAETLEAARYYEEQRAGLGERFIASIDAAIALAEENPALGRLVDHPEFIVRRFPVERFPYIVLVADREDEARMVVAVTHFARKPGYWRERLR